MDHIFIRAVDVVLFRADDAVNFFGFLQGDEDKVVFGDEEVFVEVVLFYLNVVVGKFEHYYVLAFYFEGAFQVYYPWGVYEGRALHRVRTVEFYEFFTVLYVLVVHHWLRFQSFKVPVTNRLEIQAEYIIIYSYFLL